MSTINNILKWLFCSAMCILLVSCSLVQKTTVNCYNYQEIMNNDGDEYTDLRCRSAILNFVENYRTAYNRKDIDLLAKVYSDDALIYNTEKGVKQNKKKYIKYLRSVFRKNAINIKFADIKVVRHPKCPDIFGVKLLQGWNTTNYSNFGFLFLVIDFRDSVNMQIHVRTWQQEKLNGETLSEDEIFKLGYFQITND